ncbi:hypothetical protein CDL15_Pgr022117 [Punica granatum]|nr:hypothetical protein CDL15_Pgr022117 [Punica granatum]
MHLVFSSRVIRQLGGLQDIPVDTDRSAYQLTWVEVSPSAVGRFTRVREVRQIWETRLSQNLYFPEFPTDEERAFSATSSYMARFYPQGLEPVHPPRALPAPRAPPAAIPQIESSVQAPMHMELQTIREERDRLRRELDDTRAELTYQRELQRELAQTRTHVESLNREIARLSATLDQARAKTRKVSHL